MPVKFQVSGPFPIPFRRGKHGKGKHIDKKHGAEFWEGDASEYAEKQGCYVFGLSISGSFVPYYVGKTKIKMEGECFTDHKLNHYNSIVFDYKGTPVMFFLTRRDGRKVVPTDALKQLEIFLIQTGKLKNDELVNVHHTNKLPGWSIAGVVRGGPGEDGIASRNFQKMMGL